MLTFSKIFYLLLYVILHSSKAKEFHPMNEINMTSTTTDMPILTSSTDKDYSSSTSIITTTSSKLITTTISSVTDTTTSDENYSTTTKLDYDSVDENEVLWSTSESNNDDSKSTSTSIVETTTDQTQLSSTSSTYVTGESKQSAKLPDGSAGHLKHSSTFSSSEKRGKVMKDNSNIGNLTLPDNADVWTLVGMKENPLKTDSTPVNNSATIDENSESIEKKEEEEVVGTKNLSDWSKIMKEVGVFNETTDNISDDSKTNYLEADINNTTTSKILNSPTTQESFVKSDDELQSVLFRPPDKSSEQNPTTTVKNELLSTTANNSYTTYNITNQEDIETMSSTLAPLTEKPKTDENQQSTFAPTTEKTVPLKSKNGNVNSDASTTTVKSENDGKLNNVYSSYNDDEVTTSNMNLFVYELGNPPTKDSIPFSKTDIDSSNTNTIIAVSVTLSCILIVVIALGFIYIMRKRQKQTSYGQRCRPVGLDAYSLDNVSVCNSIRRKGNMLRQSQRIYGNAAFDDPSLRHNVLRAQDIKKFSERKSSIYDEFKDVPQIIARSDEVPPGCEDLNRYANVIPLPETRVILEKQGDNEKTEYINANYVRGPKDTPNYYIATQGPLESTLGDFWRMIWEQNSNVIVMATDLVENGIEKCAEYLPPSVTLDNHTTHGNFQITLKDREVKEKYATSKVEVKNISTGISRTVYHFWYSWPEVGVPSDERSVIEMLTEVHVKAKELSNNIESDDSKGSTQKSQSFTFHCSNGTGRTGTLIACDIAIRCLNEPKRSVDIPQIVYCVRRGRAKAIHTKEQYEFIYRVAATYANKITSSEQ